MNYNSYKVTFVEAKNRRSQRTFLLGSAVLVVGGTIFSIVGSIYNSDAYVAALDDSLVYLASVNGDEPMKMEEPDLSEKKASGGGGEGGRPDHKPVSAGVLASQTEKPLIAPSRTMDPVTDPEIKIRMQTKGVVERKPTNERYGNPNSTFNVPSDGFDGEGGQGNSPTRGQGEGDGPGGGPEKGPAYGPGPGGSGIQPKKVIKPKSEDNDERKKDDPPKYKEPVGETVAMKILDKPRAVYTDEARRIALSGTVTLRVTFNASGSIGNITVVSALSAGLTENAVAAARNIRFEPAKKNGIPVTVTKQIAYTYTLY